MSQGAFPKAKWTLMVYMASLSTYAEMDLAEMQWIGSGEV